MLEGDIEFVQILHRLAIFVKVINCHGCDYRSTQHRNHLGGIGGDIFGGTYCCTSRNSS